MTGDCIVCHSMHGLFLHVAYSEHCSYTQFCLCSLFSLFDHKTDVGAVSVVCCITEVYFGVCLQAWATAGGHVLVKANINDQDCGYMLLDSGESLCIGNAALLHS